jgi:hypothetical protein
MIVIANAYYVKLFTQARGTVNETVSMASTKTRTDPEKKQVRV